MMKLSNMKKIVETVDKEWRSPIAEGILERWGYDRGSVYYFRASSNFVFMFKKDGKRRFLRFIHSEEREKASIEAEIILLIHLKDHSIKAAEPVLSLNQQYVETFETEGGTLHAVVFEGLEGDHYELEEMGKDQFQSWGAALGELHQVLKDVPLNIQAKRGSWEEHTSQLKNLLPKKEALVLRELDRVEEWAKGLPISKENFDDSACYWYAADIALALRDLLQEGRTGNHSGYQSFLNGYNSRRSCHDPLLRELS
jgi:Ser/Thr protein kinase RdoA (MazF antagonist)